MLLSLRRHNPDQVMRVERCTLLSACSGRLPVILSKPVYGAEGYLSRDRAVRPGLPVTEHAGAIPPLTAILVD